MAKKAVSTMFLGRCPICRKKLQDKNLSVIDKNDSATLCCVKCVSCESSVLFTVSSMDHNMITTVGILTDVQEQDLPLLKGDSKVSYDDVLALYAYLKNHGTTQSEIKK